MARTGGSRPRSETGRGRRDYCWHPLRCHRRPVFLRQSAFACWRDPYFEDGSEWRGRECRGMRRCLTDKGLGEKGRWRLVAGQAFGMHQRMGMARVCEELFSKKAESSYLQARRRRVPSSEGTWSPCPLLQSLPGRSFAWGLHRQETVERVGRFSARIYGCPCRKSRRSRVLARSPRSTWRSCTPFPRPSGKVAKEARGLERSERRREREGTFSGPCSHWTRFADRRWERWPRRPCRPGTRTRTTFSAGSSGGAEGGSSRDFIRGRKGEEEQEQEENGGSTTPGGHREKAEDCGAGEEGEGKQQQQAVHPGEKEEKEKEEARKEYQFNQWIGIIQQLYGNASTSSEEIQTATRFGARASDESRERSPVRCSDHWGSRRRTDSQLWQTHELLSDPGASTIGGQNPGPSRARDGSPVLRPVDGGSHRGDGRRHSRKVHSNRDSGNQRQLEHSSTPRSGALKNARSCPSAFAAVRSATLADGREGIGSRFMGRIKALRRMVARQSRRQRRPKRTRKRKGQTGKEQKQRKEGKEECMERWKQSKRRRRWGDSSCLRRSCEEPKKRDRNKEEECPAPNLKAAEFFKGAGSPRWTAVRRKVDNAENLQKDEEQPRREGRERIEEAPALRIEKFTLHDEGQPTDGPLVIPGEAEELYMKRRDSETWVDVKSFKDFAQWLAQSLVAGVSDGAVAPFAKLLAPNGDFSTPSAMHGPRWGLFPLPVNFEGSLLRSRENLEDSGADLWVQMCAMSLNRLAGVKDRAPVQRESKQVRRVLENLRCRIERFLRCSRQFNFEAEKIWSEVKTKKISYEGEEVSQPLELSYNQILASVPPKGHGGSVALAPLLRGRAKFLLEHPAECLLAAEERSPGSCKARVHIKAGEELKVWKLLEERGVIKWLDVDKVFRDAHDSCSAGMFGVPKTGKFTKEGEVILRVIMNLKPLNRLLTVIRGDIGDLPTPMSWTQLVVAEDELIEVSQADMSSAFYLFSLPLAWLPYMSFSCSFERGEVGLKGRGRVTPCCQVLPMGWASSVGLMQMASRQLLHMADGNWGGELKRTSLTPPWFVQRALREGGDSWWQVYLDNFMAAEVKPKKHTTSSESVRLHEQAVKAWVDKGVLCAEDKHVIAGRDAVELGVNIQGEEGWLGGSPERFQKLISVTMSLLSLKNPRPRWVQIVLGRWIFVLQFRRPGMAVLSNCWNYIRRSQDRRRWWPVVQKELAQLVCMVPLLQFDLRTNYSPLVSCSDASEGGGAIASSRSLTSAGMSVGRNLGSSDNGPIAADILVISVFNGIGGALRAYDVAGIKVAGIITLEIDPAAQRVTRKAWPQVIEMGNIESVDRKKVRQWYNLFPRVSHVHVYGGFPCVHLSSARADRQNLEGEGSKLFWNLKQLIDDVEAIFGETAEVEYVVENVFSMDVEAREEISTILQIEPLVLCPSDVLPFNRPRLAWVSYAVEAGPGVVLERCQGYTRVWMEAIEVSDSQWLSPGWERCSQSQPFATFMKAIRRRHPPVRPAGMQRCEPEALQRWREDDHKFPPYQYRYYNLVRDKQGNLRQLNSEERALLLGFGMDHLLFSWSAGKAKESPWECEDKKLSLAGDSFAIISFGWIASQLCRKWVRPRTPQELLDRLGLAPGATLSPHLSCPLARSLGYGPMRSSPVSPEALVAHLARHVNITGSDVSLALGTPFTLKSCNHSSLRAGWWDWNMVFKNRWKHHSHINSLEMRMILLSVKWRARSPESLNCRRLHLADSMVCNYILSKGRTSSRLLQPITQEIAAFLLALNSSQLHGHVDSLENPTDAASREAYDC